MSKQYWIGGFFIDLSRNQITQNQQIQTLAPKALAVLTCLAENHGKVVSQDDLLTQVWPDTVVSPNTLQRSIAQLRKALGDDGKGQIYIQTHAKQGYSLECDVRWQAFSDKTSPSSSQTHVVDPTAASTINDEVDTTKNSPASKVIFILLATLAGFIVWGVFGFKNSVQQPSPLSFDTLRLLTATDDKEFDATYSPDGQYIVFHRYLDKQCINKIWAKHIKTQQEIQLTENWGAYGSHDFSPDGQQLVFLATEPCDKPMTQTSCYDLVSLDFAQALESPQQASTILQCKNSIVKKPKWISDNNITLLQRNSDRWKLINYSVSEHKSTDFYAPSEGNVIDYAYSAANDLLAVSSFHNDGQQYLEMFEQTGQLLSSHPIELPAEIPGNRPIYPNFDPLNEQLIFSTGRQLFTLSYEGQVAKINLPFADRMSQPEFHPDGSRLLMLKGPYDSDVVLATLDTVIDNNPLAAKPLDQPMAFNSFERTNLGEDYAIFQPDGALIAFWSERSGEQQVWISNGHDPQQLTNFPIDTYISGIDWAADGQSLLVNANNVLTQVYLDSKQSTYAINHPVVRLYQWDSINNSALLLLRIEGIYKFVAYDFNHNEITEIANDKIILWGLKSADGELVYKDHMDQFWRPGPIEAQRIEPLDKQGGKSKSFVINGNVIYAINKENQLWSYDLNSEIFTVLGLVSDDVDYLTDVNQSQLLMTVQVAAKKEVVELTVSD